MTLFQRLGSGELEGERKSFPYFTLHGALLSLLLLDGWQEGHGARSVLPKRTAGEPQSVLAPSPPVPWSRHIFMWLIFYSLSPRCRPPREPRARASQHVQPNSLPAEAQGPFISHLLWPPLPQTRGIQSGAEGSTGKSFQGRLHPLPTEFHKQVLK